jgi:hypothetical protein
MNTNAAVGVCLCVGCGAEIVGNRKAGEVRITITAKINVSLTLSGPLCDACATATRRTPEAAMSMLRMSSSRVLTGQGYHDKPF